jgi:siroheme synthase
MGSRPLVPSALSSGLPGASCGCVFLIRSDPAHAHLLARPARAALASADAVLHGDDLDPRILTLIPHGAFVELVASDSDCAPAKSLGIARARKLASEGWRVVWLVSEDDQHSPAALAAAGEAIHVCTDVCAHEPQSAIVDGRGPQPLASALNGLAG